MLESAALSHMAKQGISLLTEARRLRHMSGLREATQAGRPGTSPPGARHRSGLFFGLLWPKVISEVSSAFKRNSRFQFVIPRAT